MALATTLLSTATVVAEPGRVAGDKLRQLLSGRTVIVNTPIGSLPITYRENGTMTGRAAALAALTGREQDSGHWWIAGDQLCQRWRVWLDGSAHCFTLRVSGAQLHWRRGDGSSGTAVIASR